MVRVREAGAVRIPDRLRATVTIRDRYACVVCGTSIVNQPGSVQPRQFRGRGGARRNRTGPGPARFIVVCGTATSGCRGWVETNRDQARESGWLVPAWRDPREIPVLYRDGKLYYLDTDGGVHPARMDPAPRPLVEQEAPEPPHGTGAGRETAGGSRQTFHAAADDHARCNAGHDPAGSRP